MSVTKYRVWCLTEGTWVEGWGQTEPTACYNNNTHTINPNSVQDLETVADTFDVDTDGKIKVSAAEATLFGELKVAEYTPIIQNYCMYGIINNQFYTSYSAFNGTITSDANGIEIDLQITDDLYSYAVLRTTQILKYRPGYANLANFNAVFDVGTTNCLQFGGVGNNGSDLYFCYDGVDFGVRKSTGGMSHVMELCITGAETTNSTADIVLNGVTYSVPLTDSGGNMHFTAAEIANHSYPGWNVENIGCNVYFHHGSVGPKSGDYSYNVPGGSSGGSFSTIKTGANLTTTFVPQTEWNGTSTMIASLDPTQRNMYSIEYTWYGSGNIRFKVYNPDKSIYETVHTMTFANSQIEASLTAPNMFLQWGVSSLGSTTSKKVRVCGGFGATQGKINVKYPLYSVISNKSMAANTETVLLALKNRTQINGFSNQSETLVERLTFSTIGNKPVVIKVIRNPSTLSQNNSSDFINWDFVNVNSICLADIMSKTYTGGSTVDEFQIPPNGSLYVDLNNKEYQIHQGDIFLISAESRDINEIDMSLTLLEDL